MLNFTIKNGQVTVDEAAILTVSAFNKIWEYDTSKNKTKAMQILTYIFHMCDIRDINPCRDLAEHEREATCKINSFGNRNYAFSDVEKALIEKGMAWYEVLTKDSVQRFARAIDKKIDEMSQFMEDPANAIKNATDMELQGRYMASFDKLLKTKASADDFVNKTVNKKRVKGNAVESPLEAGLLD